MTQRRFAPTGCETYRKTTGREVFLAEMTRVVPWADRCAVSEPLAPQPSGAGRRPVCGPWDAEGPAAIRRWSSSLPVETLHLAGPNEGTVPGIEEQTYRLLLEVFVTIRKR